MEREGKGEGRGEKRREEKREKKRGGERRGERREKREEERGERKGRGALDARIRFLAGEVMGRGTLAGLGGCDASIGIPIRE